MPFEPSGFWLNCFTPPTAGRVRLRAANCATEFWPHSLQNNKQNDTQGGLLPCCLNTATTMICLFDPGFETLLIICYDSGKADIEAESTARCPIVSLGIHPTKKNH
jgi:hypothetical protein